MLEIIYLFEIIHVHVFKIYYCATSLCNHRLFLIPHFELWNLSSTQVNKEPKHFLDNSFSCIGLIFTVQGNLIIESGVYLLSLNSNCHHKVFYSKFDLQIFYPPYLREVWRYKDVKTELIRRSIVMFDWQSFLKH